MFSLMLRRLREGVRNPEQTKTHIDQYSEQTLGGAVRGLRIISATQPDGSDLYDQSLWFALERITRFIDSPAELV